MFGSTKAMTGLSDPILGGRSEFKIPTPIENKSEDDLGCTERGRVQAKEGRGVQDGEAHDSARLQALNEGTIANDPEKDATLGPPPSQGSALRAGVSSLLKIGKPDLPQIDLDEGIVGWDGQDDPAMPMNFSKGRKWGLLGQVAAITFLSPLASSIFAPGVSFMDKDFHSTSTMLSSFVVSVFVLGYVVGPLFLAPASEIYGRRPVLRVANCFFVVWQIGSALAPNLGSLIAFRFLAGIGGSGCLTLGGGIIADMFVPRERGAANAVYAMGPLFGPVVGPIMGGFVAQRAGWRWIFWVLLCAGAVMTIFMEIFFQETYGPVLIAKKTARLSKELNRSDLRSCYEAEGVRKTKIATIKRGITRPLRMLFLSPVVAIFSSYMALVYGLFYFLLTTITSVYTTTYGWSAEITGLAYLGIGLGFFIGLAAVGTTTDKVIIALTKKNNGVYEPEMRLPYMIFFAFLIPISFFWYGWTADKAVHWIVPLISLVPFGIGMIGIFSPIQIYLIDSFPMYAASAVAALMVSRSLLGALLPLAGPRLYQSLGLGWGNSLLGFIALAMIPAPYYLWKYGGAIRKNHPIKL